MEPYQTLYPQAGKSLSETEKLVLRVVQLPTGTAVSENDITKVCTLIRFIVSTGKQISTGI
jgi:dTDP-4-amino-4,6-dideoxygalactose transaminase